MDIATVAGILGALLVVVTVLVLGGDPGLFVDGPSLLLVVGGTACVVLVKFDWQQLRFALGFATQAFRAPALAPRTLIAEVVTLAETARNGGLPALQNESARHPLLRKGIRLLQEGHDPAMVQSLLETASRESLARQRLGVQIWFQIGDAAPALGLVGTLIGLVQLLAALNDPASVMAALALALLTTFYGAVLAYVLALPLANKLNVRCNGEYRLHAMIIDALLAIQAGQNPAVIRSLLNAYLPPSAGGNDAA